MSEETSELSPEAISLQTATPLDYEKLKGQIANLQGKLAGAELPNITEITSKLADIKERRTVVQGKLQEAREALDKKIREMNFKNAAIKDEV